MCLQLLVMNSSSMNRCLHAWSLFKLSFVSLAKVSPNYSYQGFRLRRVLAAASHELSSSMIRCLQAWRRRMAITARSLPVRRSTLNES